MEALPRDDQQTQVVSHAVKHHWRAVAVVTILVTAAATVFLLLRAPSYTSKATVLIQPLVGNALAESISSNGQNATVAMQTEANLVKSLAVTKLVDENLHSSLQPDRSTALGTVPINTQLVDVSYTAGSPESARRYAQAYASAFLQYRSNQAGDAQSVKLNSLKNQAATIQNLLALESKLANQPKPPADAASKIQLYETQLASIQADIAQAVAISTRSGSIIVSAGLPASSSVLVLVGEGIAAAILGLLLGSALAVWRERRDDRIRSSAERTVAGMPVLAKLPRVRNSAKAASNPARDEAFRRAKVGVLAGAPRASVIAVSAVAAHESAADVAVSLARALASAGYRVVLVDAAVEGSTVATRMGIRANPGLSDLLASDPARLIDVELAVADGVRVLPGGSHMAEARELYAGAAVSALLGRLRGESDYVLLATSPITTGDGMSAVLGADSVLLVARDRKSTHEQIEEACEASRRIGVEPLGLVIVGRPIRRRGKARSRKLAKAAERTPAIASGPSTSTAPAGKTARPRPGNHADSAPQAGSDQLAGAKSSKGSS